MMAAFKSGEQHARWSGGKSTNHKGYIKINAGANRDKYEHRVVVEELLKHPISYMFSPGDGIPFWMTIHHQDHNRQHNCVGNLMLLQQCIHNALSRSYRAYILDHYDEYLEKIRRENEDECPF